MNELIKVKGLRTEDGNDYIELKSLCNYIMKCSEDYPEGSLTRISLESLAEILVEHKKEQKKEQK